VLNPIKIIILIILIVSISIFGSLAYGKEKNAGIKPWKELDADPQYSAGQSLEFYNLKIENGSRATLVVLDLNDRHFELLPFFCENTTCPSEIAKKEKTLVAINGGFFNLNNGESTSYVVINGQNQCEPKHNKALTENPALKPYLETIFNRSELRILENKEGKRQAIITPHNAPLPNGWTLVHSLQAGPMLVPTINDTEEAFVRKIDSGKIVEEAGILSSVIEQINKENPAQLPILLKLSPDSDNRLIEEVMAMGQKFSLAGYVCSNTSLTRSGLKTKNAQDMKVGGLSGPPLKSLALALCRRIYELKEDKQIVIGCGGITNGQDAYDFIRAGASTLQLYTALVYEGPGIVRKVCEELSALLKKDGLTVSRAVGADCLSGSKI